MIKRILLMNDFSCNSKDGIVKAKPFTKEQLDVIVELCLEYGMSWQEVD